MIILTALAMLATSGSPADIVWKSEPDAQVAPRSFLCSRDGKGIAYIVAAKTTEQNFVDFWEKYTGDVKPLELSIKSKTEFATVGDQRFLITSTDKSGNMMRLELWPDAEMGLKGHYISKVGEQESRGDCSLIAMLPGYENFK